MAAIVAVVVCLLVLWLAAPSPAKTPRCLSGKHYHSTAYGPPWTGINGFGVTALGIDLRAKPRRYGIAVDPRMIPLRSKVWIWPNPFGRRRAFTAFDTGGAIKGNRLDFYDNRGRSAQYGWGRRAVRVCHSIHFSEPWA
ncbi:MAG TPA: 3D domain-containing protein [Vicinamibacterales bacterium]|nr:3D domain-containing protein [Vicinamibacterales bacterium]